MNHGYRIRLRLAVGAAVALLLPLTLALHPAAEDSATYGTVPIAETTAQPNNSTSVYVPERKTAAAVSYGLRVLAAREEMVISGLCGNELSFTVDDIRRAMNLSSLEYITVTELPATADGTLFVGSVGAAKGQVISAGSLGLLSFAAADDEKPSEATMKIAVNGSDYDITCRLCLLEELNYTPTVALASSVSLHIETYRGVPTVGTISAYDPEGDEMTFEIVRYAEHGRVTLRDRNTGAYVYAPDEGFTGKDSFTYVVRDRWGNYSTSATVSIEVISPPASVSYADIDGEENAGSILKVSALGLMNGTQVGADCYFKPAEEISRLEFLVTAMQAAGIGEKEVAALGAPSVADVEDIPVAMRPYVSYALQKNYISAKPDAAGKLCLRADESISRAEAAVILSNIIGYAKEDTVTAFADADTLPTWSTPALTSLRALGVLNAYDGNANASAKITRSTTAAWLARTIQLMEG